MRPLYDARIEDLGEGDFLRVECAACGHDEMIPQADLRGVRRQPAELLARERTGWRYALPLDTALVTSRVRVRA